jgi:hypothetical protein
LECFFLLCTLITTNVSFDNFLQPCEEKKTWVQKVQREFFWKKWAQVATFRGKKSLNHHFKKNVPTSHHIIVGILNYSTSHFDLESNLVKSFMHDHQPTYFTNLKKENTNYNLAIQILC